MEYHQKTLIALVITFLGCGGSFPKPKNYDDSARRLIDSIERRGKSLESLSGELAIELWRKDERVRAKQLIAVDGKGRLRIEVLSPFGQPITTLASDGSRLMIYDAQHKRFYLGAATTDALARLLPVQMNPDELSHLLRGTIPIIQYKSAAVSWNSEVGRYRLSLTGESRGQLIEFEPEYLRVTKVEMRVGSDLLYSVKLGDYSGTGDAIVPRRILFLVPAKELRVDLTVLDYTLNPTLPHTAFTLDAPRGIVVEPL